MEKTLQAPIFSLTMREIWSLQILDLHAPFPTMSTPTLQIGLLLCGTGKVSILWSSITSVNLNFLVPVTKIVPTLYVLIMKTSGVASRSHEVWPSCWHVVCWLYLCWAIVWETDITRKKWGKGYLKYCK